MSFNPYMLKKLRASQNVAPVVSAPVISKQVESKSAPIVSINPIEMKLREEQSKQSVVQVKKVNPKMQSPNASVAPANGSVKPSKSGVKPANGGVKPPKEEVTSAKEDVKSAKEDVKSAKEEVKSAKEEVKAIKKKNVKAIKKANKPFKALNPADYGDSQAQINDLSGQIDGLRENVDNLLSDVGALDAPGGVVDEIVNDITLLESNLTQYENKVKSINPDNVNIMDNLLLKRIDVAENVIVPLAIPADSTIYSLNDAKLIDPNQHLHYVKMLDAVPANIVQLNMDNATECYDYSVDKIYPDPTIDPIEDDAYFPINSVILTTANTARYDVQESEFDKTRYTQIIDLSANTLITLSEMVNTMYLTSPTIRINSDLVSQDEYKAGNTTYHYEYDAKTNINTLKDASDNIVTLNDLRELVDATLDNTVNYVLLFNNLAVKMIKATISYETQVTFDARPKAVTLKENNNYIFKTVDNVLCLIKATTAPNNVAPNKYAAIESVVYDNANNNMNFLSTTSAQVYYVNNDNSVHLDGDEPTSNYYYYYSKIQTIDPVTYKLSEVDETILFNDSNLVIYTRFYQPLVSKFFVAYYNKLYQTDENGALTLNNLEDGLLTLPNNFNIIYQISIYPLLSNMYNNGILLSQPTYTGEYNIKINNSETEYNPSTDTLEAGDILTVFDKSVDLPATNLAGILLVNMSSDFSGNIWYVNEDATLSAPSFSNNLIIDNEYIRQTTTGNTQLQDYFGSINTSADYYMVITQYNENESSILKAVHMVVADNSSSIGSLSGVFGNYLYDLSENSLFLLDANGDIVVGANVPEDSLVSEGTKVMINTGSADDEYKVFQVSNDDRTGELVEQSFNEGDYIYLLTTDDTITLNAAIEDSYFDLTLNTTIDHHEHIGIPNPANPSDPIDGSTPRILLFVGSASRTTLNKNELQDYWALEYANIFGEEDQLFIDDSTNALYKISNGDETIDAGTIVHYDDGVWEVSNYSSNSALSDLGLDSIGTGNQLTVDTSMLFVVDSSSDLTNSDKSATVVNGESKYNFAVVSANVKLAYHSSNPYYAAAPDHQNDFITDSDGILTLVPDKGTARYVVRPDNKLGWFDGTTGFYDTNSVSTTDVKVRSKNYINWDGYLSTSHTDKGDMLDELNDLMWVTFDASYNLDASNNVLTLKNQLFFDGEEYTPPECTFIYVRFNPSGPAYYTTILSANTQNGVKIFTHVVNQDQSITAEWRSMLLLSSPDVI
jgi:hypothetical protein